MSASTRKRGLRDESGATALEFALVIPVFVALLLGTFQVAWVLHCAGTVRWSLESTARSLLLDPTITQDQLSTAVLGKLSGLVDTRRVTVTLVTDTTTTGAPVLRASTTYQPTLSIPFVASWPLTLHATTAVPTP
ncbi:MAG TPA: TadE family protein [Phenylobacterium sp.]